ncbi:hypothetical protein LLG95_12460 [bacterium]|nr:hypothetical protein [bacterium]
MKYFSGLFLPIFVAICCSSCVALTDKYQDLATIQEVIKPLAIVVGEGDVWGIKVETTYCSGDEWKKSETPKPLAAYQPQQLYLVMSVEHLKSIIKSGPLKEEIPFTRILWVPDDFVSVTKKINPRKISVSAPPIPPEIVNPVIYNLSDPIPISVDGKTVRVRFDELLICSHRSKIRWWFYPMAPPLVVIDLAQAAVIAPFIFIGHGIWMVVMAANAVSS